MDSFFVPFQATFLSTCIGTFITLKRLDASVSEHMLLQIISRSAAIIASIALVRHPSVLVHVPLEKCWAFTRILADITLKRLDVRVSEHMPLQINRRSATITTSIARVRHPSVLVHVALETSLTCLMTRILAVAALVDLLFRMDLLVSDDITF